MNALDGAIEINFVSDGCSAKVGPNYFALTVGDILAIEQPLFRMTCRKSSCEPFRTIMLRYGGGIFAPCRFEQPIQRIYVLQGDVLAEVAFKDHI